MTKEEEKAVRNFNIVKNHNRDDGLKKMFSVALWFDKGAALLMYRLAKPIYYTQFATIDDVDSYNRDTFKLIKQIEKKVLTNACPKIISFDPTPYIVQYDIPNPKRTIDPIFYQPVVGSIHL